MNERPRHFWFLIALLVVGSFAVRLAALSYWGTGTIESEGAEYAKIAQNLRSGVGYVGLVSPGPQVLFNPLFPILIAAASFFTPDYEWAGRVAALIICGLLPLPAFGIASRLFNRRVGFIAALLIMLHPLLLRLSFMVYSEGPYATFLLTAIYLSIRALQNSSARAWMLAGAAFAFCYLLRAEAFAGFAIAMLFALAATEGQPKTRITRVAYAVAVFLIIALPEVIFLYKTTGKVALEGKSAILFSYTGGRVLAAEKRPDMPYTSAGGQDDVPSPAPNTDGGYPERWQDKWAFYGIDGHLNPTGTAMRPFADIARETKVKIANVPPLVAKGIRTNASGLLRKFATGWFGAPLFPALALLGIFAQPWHRPQATLRLFLIAITAAPVMATLFVLWGDPRYYFIFVPLLSIWAANGLFEIGMWMKASCLAAGWTLAATPLQWIAPSILGFATILSPFKETTTLYEFDDSSPAFRIDKEVGQWIGRQQGRHVRIMDLTLPLSYHANAEQHVYFPYATGELALAYLDAAKVDYVVLRRGHKYTKYYEEWMAHGIPDARAERVQLSLPVPGADGFVVYKWHWDRPGETSHISTTPARSETTHVEQTLSH